MSAELMRFHDRVVALVEQVKGWAEAHEWVTKEYPKRMRNGENQTCEIPALFLQRGPTRVLLDPIAYDVPGGEGLVDLYLMPGYDDVASLYFKDGSWAIHYTFSPNQMKADPLVEAEALPLREDTINRVLDAIASHAEHSI
jgi:hypothetical protein